MGPRTRAAIFTQRGSVDPAKQIAACLDFINGRRWTFRHYAPSWAPGAAAELAHAGEVDVIVTAFDSRAAQTLAAEVRDHVRVIYVHPEPTTIEPPRERIRGPVSLVSLILKWARGGRTAKEIAAELETDTGEIQAIIRRKGRGFDRPD